MTLDATAISDIHERFRAGEAEATRTVTSWVEAVVRSGNWRFEDPEGVVQEIVFELYRRARSGGVRDPGAFQKFVWTVAKCRAVDTYHRDRKREDREGTELDPARAPEDAAASPERALESLDRAEALVYIVQRLPAACRDLWAWVYKERMPAEAVAAKLGITANNARVRVHRCLQKARALYADYVARVGRVT